MERIALLLAKPLVRLGIAAMALLGAFAFGAHLGYTEAEEKCRIQTLESENEGLQNNVDALDQWIAKQAEVVKGASVENAGHLESIASIEDNIAELTDAYEDLARSRPLPVSCNAGPDRVRAANEALAAAYPAGD